MNSGENMVAPAPAVADPPPLVCDGGPAEWLRLSRGFSCLFWSMPLLSTAHVLALLSFLSAPVLIGALAGGFLPLAWGLWLLHRLGDWAPGWQARIRRLAVLGVAAMGLSPFLAWWTDVPLQAYFAANAAGHYLVVIMLLAGLNRLTGACAHRLGDVSLRREAHAGFVMVLWLSACTVGALTWMFHRAGVLAAGADTILWHVSRLRGAAHLLVTLPYAMTAYVMWRAKETGFRRALAPSA